MKNFWNSLRENFNAPPLNYLILFLFLATLLVSQSCKKEYNSIGLNIKDRDDFLNADFTDTTTLIAYSVLEDTLNTTNLISNYLGYLQDNVFGTTTADMFTQFVPAGNVVPFGEESQLDSIVLTLRYAGGFYGDTLKPFVIKVYELTEDILPATTYYQNNSVNYSYKNLTYYHDFRLSPKPNTKVKIDTLLEAHARIRLSNDLGNYFLGHDKEMETPERFKQFFKGLYICAAPYGAVPSRGGGSLVNFTLTNALSGIQLYYKRKGETNQSVLSFIVDNRFGSYKHEYKTGDVNFVNQVSHKDTSLGRNMLYVQSMGGVKTKITFPNLKALKDKKMVINKAELVITNIGEEPHLYPVPTRLGIQGINSSGTVVYIPDDAVFTNTAYWGGSYNASAKEYRFRITRYIQEIILRDNFQPAVYLVAEGSAAYANRLLLGGTDPEERASRLRLEIYYTEY